MESASLTDQIIKRLSFEVEAALKDKSQFLTNNSHGVPVDVKIRVKQKKDGNQQAGVLSRIVETGKRNRRIRLVSSDQTIMSFNMLLETDDFDMQLLESQPQTDIKAKKYLFGVVKPGGCLEPGSEDEDRYPYLPSSSNAKTNEIIRPEPDKARSDHILTKNSVIRNTRVSRARQKSGKSIFGKFKPGGCLDAYGDDEDFYKYSPKIIDNNNQHQTTDGEIEKLRFHKPSADSHLIKEQIKSPESSNILRSGVSITNDETSVDGKIEVNHEINFNYQDNVEIQPEKRSSFFSGKIFRKKKSSTDTNSKKSMKDSKISLEVKSGHKREKSITDSIITYPTDPTTSDLLIQSDDKIQAISLTEDDKGERQISQSIEVIHAYYTPPRGYNKNKSKNSVSKSIITSSDTKEISKQDIQFTEKKSSSTSKEKCITSIIKATSNIQISQSRHSTEENKNHGLAKPLQSSTKNLSDTSIGNSQVQAYVDHLINKPHDTSFKPEDELRTKTEPVQGRKQKHSRTIFTTDITFESKSSLPNGKKELNSDSNSKTKLKLKQTISKKSLTDPNKNLSEPKTKNNFFNESTRNSLLDKPEKYSLKQKTTVDSEAYSNRDSLQKLIKEQSQLKTGGTPDIPNTYKQQSSFVKNEANILPIAQPINHRSQNRQEERNDEQLQSGTELLDNKILYEQFLLENNVDKFTSQTRLLLDKNEKPPGEEQEQPTPENTILSIDQSEKKSPSQVTFELSRSSIKLNSYPDSTSLQFSYEDNDEIAINYKKSNTQNDINKKSSLQSLHRTSDIKKSGKYKEDNINNIEDTIESINTGSLLKMHHTLLQSDDENLNELQKYDSHDNTHSRVENIEITSLGKLYSKYSNIKQNIEEKHDDDYDIKSKIYNSDTKVLLKTHQLSSPRPQFINENDDDKVYIDDYSNNNTQLEVDQKSSLTSTFSRFSNIKQNIEYTDDNKNIPIDNMEIMSPLTTPHALSSPTSQFDDNHDSNMNTDDYYTILTKKGNDLTPNLNKINFIDQLDDRKIVKGSSSSNVISKPIKNRTSAVINDINSNKIMRSSSNLLTDESKLQITPLSVDLAFQNYKNQNGERVFRSIDSNNLPKENKTKNFEETIATFQTKFLNGGTPLLLKLDDDDGVSIKYFDSTNSKYMDLPKSQNKRSSRENPSENKKTSGASSTLWDKHNDEFKESTLTDKKSAPITTKQYLQKTLSSIYTEELVPLKNTIKKLKAEIDSLAKQQELMRNKLMGTRLIPVNEYCGCTGYKKL